MAKRVLLDELHVQLLIPSDLPTDGLKKVRRLVHGRRFRQQVVGRVRTMLCGIPELSAVSVRLVK